MRISFKDAIILVKSYYKLYSYLGKEHLST